MFNSVLICDYWLHKDDNVTARISFSWQQAPLFPKLYTVLKVFSERAAQSERRQRPYLVSKQQQVLDSISSAESSVTDSFRDFRVTNDSVACLPCPQLEGRRDTTVGSRHMTDSVPEEYKDFGISWWGCGARCLAPLLYFQTTMYDFPLYLIPDLSN